MTLPDFLIVGAPYSGAGFVADYLANHPQVYLPKQRRPDYLAFGDGKGRLAGSVVRTEPHYRRLFRKGHGYPAVGEASESTFFEPRAMSRMQGLLPNVRIVCVLRDPVERAFVAWAEQRRIGTETTRTLFDALAHEPERASEEWHPAQRYREFGSYLAPVRRLLDHVPMWRVHFVDYGAWARTPDREIAELLWFLDLDERLRPTPTCPRDVARIDARETPTARVLERAYRPERAHLGRLAGIDTSAWLGGSASASPQLASAR